MSVIAKVESSKVVPCLLALCCGATGLVQAQTARPLLSIETPAPRINQAFEAARDHLDQQLACDSVGRCRPPIGAAILTWGLSAAGGFARSRATLAALAERQAADGRISDALGPEATPAWLLAFHQYWTASGDDVFLEQHWPSLVRAFRWAAATDTNGDGLMENAPASPPGAIGATLLTDIHLAAIWTAALDGMQQLAHGAEDDPVAVESAELAKKAQHTLDEAFWIDSLGVYASALLRADTSGSARNSKADYALTPWPVTATAFNLLAAERAERMLERVGSAQITADWGVRSLSRSDVNFDPLHYSNGAVWPFLTGIAALGHYQRHRAWAGFDLLRAIARATFDFGQGRTPALLSGAAYKPLAAHSSQSALASSAFVTAIVRGMIGWQSDAHNRAAALEPHLPAGWRTFRASNLRVGRDRIEVVIARDAGTYTVHLRKLTPGAAVAVRVAPALPAGARLERIVVNDADVAVQAEESAHDLHALAEVTLVRDAQIEFQYAGGIEVVAAAPQVLAGDSSSTIRVLNFNRDGRDFIVELEGPAGTTDTVHFRTESRVRLIRGSDSFQQTQGWVSALVTLPAGSGFLRKTLRIRI